MANLPARPSFFAAVAAIAEAIEDDPRVQSALAFLEGAGMARTARVVRELVQSSPQAAQGVAQAALDGLRSEAAELDDYLARRISRTVDEALVRGKTRTEKAKRLTAGSQSRARQAARKGRSKR